MNRLPDDVIRVQLASSQRSAPTAPLHAVFIAIGLAVAALAGMSLGLLAGTRTWIGESDWSATVQAHGRVQLWGFAVVLVAGLAPEFLARFNGRALPSPRLRLASAALMGGGALLGAPSAFLPKDLTWLAEFGAAMALAGSLGFAWTIRSIPWMRPLAADLHPLFFMASAVWLVVGAYLFVQAADGAIGGVFPDAETRAMHEVLLRGFILSIVTGVTLRALPGHAGSRLLSVRQQAVVFVLLEGGITLWFAGSGGLFDASPEWAFRTGNALTAAAIVVYTWMTGLYRPARLRDADTVNLFIRVAWAGGITWAALLAWWAAAPDAISVYREGAIRHTMMLGFMAPLILAFAHIVLARFGNGVIARRPLLTAGFVLVVMAWPLRVAAGLAFEPDDAASRALMGIAGISVMIGFGMAAFAAAATATALSRARRHVFHTFEHTGRGRGPEVAQ